MFIKLPSKAQVKDWLSVTKNVLEILAILIAAAWAYSRYVESEKPQLQPRLLASSSLTWFNARPDSACLGSFSVHIKNIGKAPVTLSKGTLRAWLIEDTSKGPIQYLDTRGLTEGKPAFEKHFDLKQRSALIGVISIDGEAQEDFTFKLQKSESQIVLFSFSAEGTSGTIEESRWSYLCDISTAH